MKISVVLFVAFGLALSSVDAGLVGGRRTYAHYSRCGLWNDRTARRGFIIEECCPADVSFPGNAWQQLSVAYDLSDGTYPTLKHYKANGDSCSGITVVSERPLHDADGQIGIEHVYKMGALTLTKTETWNFYGQVVLIKFKAKYATEDCRKPRCAPIRGLTVMHAVDPDQDRAFTDGNSTFTTLNDVLYGGLYAEATGPNSCQAFAYGICTTRYTNGARETVGFTPGWDTDARTTRIRDYGGATGDYALHYQHRESREMHCGDEREFSFIVTWGRCFSDSRNNFLAARKDVCPCHQYNFAAIPTQPRCRGYCPCPGKLDRPYPCGCQRACIRRIGRGVVDVPADPALALERSALSRDACSSATFAGRVANSNPNLRAEKSTNCRISIGPVGRRGEA